MIWPAVHSVYSFRSFSHQLQTERVSVNSPFSTLVLGWGPLKARNLPGTIQFRSPFSTRYKQTQKQVHFPKQTLEDNQDELSKFLFLYFPFVLFKLSWWTCASCSVRLCCCCKTFSVCSVVKSPNKTSWKAAMTFRQVKRFFFFSLNNVWPCSSAVFSLVHCCSCCWFLPHSVHTHQRQKSQSQRSRAAEPETQTHSSDVCIKYEMVHWNMETSVNQSIGPSTQRNYIDNRFIVYVSVNWSFGRLD